MSVELPAGFAPVQGAARIFSKSQQTWADGRVIGVCIAPVPGHQYCAPGSLYVEYPGPTKMSISKVVLASDIPEMISCPGEEENTGLLSMIMGSTPAEILPCHGTIMVELGGDLVQAILNGINLNPEKMPLGSVHLHAMMEDRVSKQWMVPDNMNKLTLKEAESSQSVVLLFNTPAGVREVVFDRHPLGLTFSDSAPLTVVSVVGGGQAADAGVDNGWILTRAGNKSVQGVSGDKAHEILRSKLSPLKTHASLEIHFKTPEGAVKQCIFSSVPLGFHFASGSSPISVSSVQAKGPAAAAGVQVGWQIISIAGMSLHGLDYEEQFALLVEQVDALEKGGVLEAAMSMMLLQQAAPTLPITFDTGSGTTTITFSGAPLGFKFLPNRNPIVVCGMDEGGLAEKMGVKVGWAIVQAGGMEMKDLSFADEIMILKRRVEMLPTQ